MQSEFYFAYGSNLNTKNWQERTGIPFNKAFEKCGTAYLPDERLAFTRRSAIPGGGVLDIIPSPGHVVAGAVYRTKTNTAMFALDRKEGFPYCYQKVKRIVFTANGQSVLVFTYKAVEQEEYIEPHPDYVKTVAEGLRSFGLPTECLLAAATNKPMPFMIDSFFCYGTLRKGQCRFSVIKRLGIVSEKTGSIKGTLYDCGSYPGAVLGNPKTRRRVIGDLIQVRNVTEAMSQLDYIEGFYGFGDPSSLFCRRIVPVELSNGKTALAWVYAYNRSVTQKELIKSGNWVKR
ncbi:hypothetical protein FACS1894189_3010 [Planctomycetales bacterium]|nr:hypothetical protein FACS1894189_3010 [Planctomycetales bacterium]